MSESNLAGSEITTPLLPRVNHERLLFLRNYVSLFPVFINEAILIGKISYPLVLINIASYIRSFISMSILGGLGDDTLASGAFAIAFVNITGYSLFSGLTMGIEPICSQAFGARRYNYVHATIKRGIILLLLISFPIMLVWIYMEKIPGMLLQNQDLVSEAHIFLLWSIPDLFIQSFLHPLKVYLKTKSETLPLLYCTLTANLLYWPIMSFFVTYLGYGIKGFAMSEVVSNLNLLAFIFLYNCFSEENPSDDEAEQIYEETYEDNVREWKKLLCLALPYCISVCLEWWFYEIITFLCGVLSDPKASIASMGIIIKITSLVYSFHHSLSLGVSTRVGNELGSNQPQRVKRVVVVGLSLSIAMGFMALTFVVSFREKWTRLFTNNDNIIQLTMKALLIVGFCELGNSLQTTGCGVLRGSARPMTVVIINGVSFYAVGIPVGVIMAFWFEFGFEGFWKGMLAAQITCMVGMMMVIYRTDWELEAERARELTMAVASGNHNNEDEVEAQLVDQVVVN
ncbi:PREDICTED: protein DETOXIFICATION 50-like [Camelina sativa]|uniref:Protein DETOXIFICATION n=1 Tax=Camelina sativa TaxID=90675 RepID=A0ABM0UPY3_CAMSA|nr:PREDICTED: protein DETOXIFICATION 50-like [Camelina sativa]